jgi:hypothetical protein
MTAPRGRVRSAAALRTLLVSCVLVPAAANAACVTLRTHPDGTLLEQIEMTSAESTFSLIYVHSVIGTPVSEHY